MWGSDHPVKRLKDVVHQVRRPEKPHPNATYNLVGVRLYAGGARIQGAFEGATLQAPSLNRVECGDIIYNKMWASKGTFALISAEFGPCFSTSEYPAFRPSGDNSSEFIFRVLSQQRFWLRAEAWSSGSTDRTRLNPTDFLTLPIPVPVPAEQRAIADVLGTVEGAIAKTEALIEAIADVKHATMRELLTRGIRRDKAPMKPIPARWVLGRVAEGVTHIPADWDLATLTKVAKLESGHTPDRKEPTYWDGDIPWISLQDADALGQVTISETAETIGPEGLSNSSARMLPVGTVVLQRTANVGLASVMSRSMCTSQHFANWVCGPKLDPHYLQQVFRHMSREWLRLVAGSVLPDIYMGTFKALQILLPPLSEQKKIGEVGVAYDLRIEQERETLAVLIENRNALAQELLSGRLRLPEAIIARHSNKAGKAA
ncbi:restriction endonuclease subunit S [Bosea psychrotolerans]|uniref:Restriction endonuclease S subunit n=1 Tax=Bosea psychrotolerans TaxID=1871628 RepID=A0A2S4MB38_9HYPH|nr:restriction endonuclease subunit S [Bosea psychrotolerans]POR51924.1 restriction endonuclease S subunit [Bosea psychrotolerans]